MHPLDEAYSRFEAACVRVWVEDIEARERRRQARLVDRWLAELDQARFFFEAAHATADPSVSSVRPW